MSPAFIRFLSASLVLLAAAAAHVAEASDPSSRDLDVDLARKFLFDDKPYTNLLEMDRVPGLRSKSVSQLPWTSSYMPAVMGYAANDNPGSNKLDLIFSFPFKNGYERFMSERLPQLKDLRFSMTEEQLDNLAPAEKYDLITGLAGTKESLTYQLWQQAKQQSDMAGLATWTGMCNGWGPASIIFKRPTHRIFVPSADGRFMVPLYPDDLKQLASTLFFNTTTVEAEMRPERFNILGNMPMVGKRCGSKRPEKDKSGFVTEAECEDVVPHFWHVAIVNLIGKQDQAFIADINAAAPVANYPLRGYKYKYFNPDSGREGSLEESRVLVSAFKDDLYARRRSRRAHWVVGIEMKVSKTDFKLANHKSRDSADKDLVKEVDFLYDLELDRDGEIVGGHWRPRKRNRDNAVIHRRPDHPDFIWYPPKGGIMNGAQAILPSAGTYDSTRIGYTGQFDAAAAGDWDASRPLPASWTDAARAATQVKVEIAEAFTPAGQQTRFYKQYRPQPLGKIVYELIERASK